MARCIFNRLDVRTIPAGFRGIVLWPVLAVLFAGCSLDDDRDLCCPDDYAMHYSYRPYGTEAFAEHIFSLRHFLYDDAGRFVEELRPGENLQYQTLFLAPGHYAMVTVGNGGDMTVIDTAGALSLEDLSLRSDNGYDGYVLPPDKGIRHSSNTDELFWGVKYFSIAPDGLTRGLARDGVEEPGRAVTYMNNIHCHLHIHVEWANVPPHVGDYEMELDGIASGYCLDPARSLPTGGGDFIVPESAGRTSHRLRVPLKSRELNGEFVTLRYSDGMIPIFRLFSGAGQVSPDIDLGRAFRTWGWSPSETHVQEYRIRIRIHSDGRAEVSPEIEASVEDWINGGTFY